MTIKTVRYTKQQIKEFKIVYALVMLFAIFLTFEFTRTLFPVYITEKVVVNDVTEVIIEIPVEDKSIVYKEYALPKNATGSFKSYMDYNTITSPSSKQKALQRFATTDADGFRKINGKYMVAMGTYYADRIGKEFRITLSTGAQLWVIIGEIKQDIHTDPNHQYVLHNGNIVEFIVDDEVLSDLSIYHGDVSYSGMSGRIVKIEEVTYASNTVVD